MLVYQRVLFEWIPSNLPRIIIKFDPPKWVPCKMTPNFNLLRKLSQKKWRCASSGTGVSCDPTPGSCATLPVPGAMCDPTHQNSMERSTFSTHTRGHVRPYLTSVWRILQVFTLFKTFKLLRGADAPGTEAFPTLPRSQGRRRAAPWAQRQLQCTQHSFSFSTRSRYPWRPQPCPTGVASTCGAIEAAGAPTKSPLPCPSFKWIVSSRVLPLSNAPECPVINMDNQV